MLQARDVGVLRGGGAGDRDQRFAGGVRDEVEMERTAVRRHGAERAFASGGTGRAERRSDGGGPCVERWTTVDDPAAALGLTPTFAETAEIINTARIRDGAGGRSRGNGEELVNALLDERPPQVLTDG
ncbi:hypothetical protein GCM10008174_33070 [Methylopila turkensis]|uniref:Uncharacterized protein n=1 Tax=Methylopila turkensis TaxID=1437816 RepID=A0A9W6N8N3_9HYPH|nr:hypothetical protein GCM10008174_33070 [Methylopila turkensis]